ncbi:MAG: DUF1592 domain-containing protein, partial [Planctomycetes bacterium]|nr:DUF1592 domain-containing protein [Planctomycetota bacterium]
QAGDEVAKMRVRWDDGDLEVLEVGSRELAEFELERTLTRGVHRLGVAFVNDYYDPKFPDPKRRDRNLYVDAVAVIGPLDVRPVPVAQRWVHDAVPSRGSDGSRLRAFAGALLPTLWRRPVAVSEARRHAAVGEAMLAAGEDFTAALRAVLQAALTSPNFLFRCENSTPGLALASRLSFFLWASAPDARLLRLAKAGKLGDRERLRAETRRLLADPRADSLATEFAAQWLELRNLAEFTPDPERFPEFDEALRRSLRSETELLFRAVQREDRDVRELLDCDFTFVDARLAGFYGLPRPDDAADDAAFERVELPAELRFRGGALGHGSILALTSNPTRTSPVKRGKWILENLLGAPPPPPPPGAGALANEQAVDSSKSFREQLAMHREDSKCAVCHVRMDALGLALERFDAIGHFRERDKDGVIDCSGELPGGAVVDGLVGLKHVLAADPAFVRTLALKLFVYGVGRAPRPIDRLVLDHEVDALLATGKVTIADLVLTIVDSAAFRVVGGEGEGAGDAGR